MNSLSEMIWGRGDARQIMREVRARLREAGNQNIAANVGVASAHYSLVKRYLVWWQMPIAVWHMFLAASRAQFVVILVKGSTSNLTADQTDVVTTILAKAHHWLGGNPVVAGGLLRKTLYNGSQERIVPHTRALMLMTLAEVEWDMGYEDAAFQKRAFERAGEAETLIPLIGDEQQLIRVLKRLGLFYYDHGGSERREKANQYLLQAFKLSQRVSLDQHESIRVELRRRGKLI